jgi:HlyD family secretion protein
MSVTTSPANSPRKLPGGGGPSGTPTGPGGGFLARLRSTPDDMAPEVLEFFSPAQALISRPPLPLANRVLAIIGAMVLVTIFLFCVMNIDRLATGNGTIVSLTPETVVQPLNAGVVKTIAVSAGDIVRRGQLLAQLDPTFAAADNTAAKEQVDRYQTELDRLHAEFHSLPYRPLHLTAGALIQEGIFAQRAAAREAELRYYQGQIDAQRSLAAQADANVRQYAKETGVTMDVEKIRAKLEADAVGSRLDTLQATQNRLEAERFVITNIDQAQNARQLAAALQGQLDNYNQQWFADVSQTITDDEVQLASYQDQLEHAAQNYKLIDLRAVEDSIVLSVAPVSPGSVMQSGQTFFTLVPINAPLEADVQITGDQTGFVRVGQAADIKFQTFVFTEFGEASGAVRLMSAESFLTGAGQSSGVGTPSGTSGDTIFTGSNPTSPFFYDVRVSIDRLNMHNLPQNFHITPGMPVEVDIKVGNRTIADYLIERLLPVVYEGMREPD